MSDFAPCTRAVRAGIESDAHHGAVVPALHLSTNYTFEGFNRKRRYDYSRSGNPTRDLLAEALRRSRRRRGRDRDRERHGRSDGRARARTRGRARGRVARLLRRNVASLRRVGQEGSLPCDVCGPRRSGEARRCARRKARSRLDRNTVQSAAAHHRRPPCRAGRTRDRCARRRRQHVPLAGAAAPARARCRHRRAFDDEVHQRAQRCRRRRGHREGRRGCRETRVVGELPRAHGRAVRQLPHVARPSHARRRACAYTRKTRRSSPSCSTITRPSPASTGQGCARTRAMRSPRDSNADSARC